MVLAEALHVRARLVVECCLDPVSKELVEALQFPHVNKRNVHHVDHVYPQALLSAKELRAAGLDQDEVGRLQALRDSLPNLQLLEMSGNISKSATVPSVWATSLYRSREAYEAYLERNEIPWLPASPKEFERFFTERRTALARRLSRLLGVEGASAADTSSQASPVAETIDEELAVSEAE